LTSLARWLDAEHVQPWWRDHRTDLQHLEAKYRPRIDGTSPVEVLVVEADDLPVGFVQYCPAGEYAYWPAALGLDDTVVVDGVIGVSSVLRHGVATGELAEAVEQIFAVRTESGIAAATRMENVGARRTLERCQFDLVYEGALTEDQLPPHAVYVRWRRKTSGVPPT
jgi:hypothetical protein